jgi:hypothetical protein
MFWGGDLISSSGSCPAESRAIPELKANGDGCGANSDCVSGLCEDALCVGVVEEKLAKIPEKDPFLSEDFESCEVCTNSGYKWCKGAASKELDDTCLEFDVGEMCGQTGGELILDSARCELTDSEKASSWNTCESCAKFGYSWCSDSKDEYGDTCLSSETLGDCANGKLISDFEQCGSYVNRKSKISNPDKYSTCYSCVSSNNLWCSDLNECGTNRYSFSDSCKTITYESENCPEPYSRKPTLDTVKTAAINFGSSPIRDYSFFDYRIFDLVLFSETESIDFGSKEFISLKYFTWSDLGNILRKKIYGELYDYAIENQKDFNEPFYHFSKDMVFGGADGQMEDKFYRIFSFDGKDFSDITDEAYGDFGPSPDERFIEFCSSNSREIYIGHNWKFNEIFFNIDEPASNDFVFDFSYWNGSVWNVGEIEDETRAFRESGKVSFYPYADWNRKDVNGDMLYWVRIGCSGRSFGNGPVFKTDLIYRTQYFINSFPAIRTTDYGLSDKGFLYPGWNENNDLDGNGFIDNVEFENRVDKSASARFKWQSRIPSLNRVTRWVMNLNSEFYLNFVKQYMDKVMLGSDRLDGFFIDNVQGVFPDRFYSEEYPSFTSRDYVLEYEGIYDTFEEEYFWSAVDFNEFLNKEFGDMVIIANTDAAYPELIQSADGAFLEGENSNWRSVFETYDSLKESSDVLRNSCDAGKILVIHANPEQTLSEYSDEKHKMYSLARYYLTSNECTYLDYQATSHYLSPFGDTSIYSMFDFDLGKPLGEFYRIEKIGNKEFFDKKNLIENPSFENLKNGFPEDWEYVGRGEDVEISLDNSVKLYGASSMKMSSDSYSKSGVYQDLDLKPKTVYTFSGWMKSEGLDSFHEFPYKQGLAQRLELYARMDIKPSKMGEVFQLPQYVGLGKGTEDWQYFDFVFRTEKNKSRLYLEFFDGKGEVWFDNLRLVEGSYSQNENVYARNFENGLVLVRPERFSDKDVEVDLGGSYYPLDSEGEVGNLVNQVSLENYGAEIFLINPFFESGGVKEQFDLQMRKKEFPRSARVGEEVSHEVIFGNTGTENLTFIASFSHQNSFEERELFLESGEFLEQTFSSIGVAGDNFVLAKYFFIDSENVSHTKLLLNRFFVKPDIDVGAKLDNKQKYLEEDEVVFTIANNGLTNDVEDNIEYSLGIRQGCLLSIGTGELLCDDLKIISQGVVEWVWIGEEKEVSVPVEFGEVGWQELVLNISLEGDQILGNNVGIKQINILKDGPDLKFEGMYELEDFLEIYSLFETLDEEYRLRFWIDNDGAKKAHEVEIGIYLGQGHCYVLSECENVSQIKYDSYGSIDGRRGKEVWYNLKPDFVGDFTLFYILDAGNQIFENNENVYFIHGEISPAGVDIAVDRAYNPHNSYGLDFGEATIIKADVTNFGNLDAENITVSLFAEYGRAGEKVLVDSQVIGELRGFGHESILEFEFVPEVLGKVYLSFNVSYEGDLNLENNYWEHSYWVDGDIEFEKDVGIDYVYTSDSLRVGAKNWVYIGLESFGKEDMENLTLEVYDGDNLIFEKFIDSAIPQDYNDVKISYDNEYEDYGIGFEWMPFQIGDHWLKFNISVEGDEYLANNVFEKDVFVYASTNVSFNVSDLDGNGISGWIDSYAFDSIRLSEDETNYLTESVELSPNDEIYLYFSNDHEEEGVGYNYVVNFSESYSIVSDFIRLDKNQLIVFQNIDKPSLLRSVSFNLNMSKFFDKSLEVNWNDLDVEDIFVVKICSELDKTRRECVSEWVDFDLRRYSYFYPFNDGFSHLSLGFPIVPSENLSAIMLEANPDFVSVAEDFKESIPVDEQAVGESSGGGSSEEGSSEAGGSEEIIEEGLFPESIPTEEPIVSVGNAVLDSERLNSISGKAIFIGDDGSCVPEWEACEWGPCKSGRSKLICEDINGCESRLREPDEIRSCFEESECVDEDGDGFGMGPDCLGFDIDDRNYLLRSGRIMEKQDSSYLFWIGLIVGAIILAVILFFIYRKVREHFVGEKVPEGYSGLR